MTITEAARQYEAGALPFAAFASVAADDGMSVRTAADAAELIADMRAFGEM